MHEMVYFFLHLKYINNDNFYLSDKMKFKGPTLLFSLIALSVILVSGFVFQEGAFAQMSKQGMTVTVTANEGSSKILLSGVTSHATDVAIIVTSPLFGNIIHTDQISPDADGKFMTEINVGGSQWKSDGIYIVTARHGQNNLYTIALPVEIVNGKTLETNASDDFMVNIVYTGNLVLEKDGLNIEIDAPLGGTTIGVIGSTDRTNLDVTIQVFAPNGNFIAAEQVTPDANGNFMTEINVGGSQWKFDGFYTITAQQGISNILKDSAQVEIVDGAVIPEFGAIAALILAVAIISIIVVSAKTRLSLIPRY